MSGWTGATRHWQALLCAVLMVLTLGVAQAQTEPTDGVAIPAVLPQRVFDQTDTLTPEAKQHLTQKLRDFEQRKGAQIAVVIVPTTGGVPIEEFANKAFRAWGLGRAGINDGVLILVAKNDRTVRIEVGYGLEGAVTDAMSRRIIRDNMLPTFREGNFAAGIESGVDDLFLLIDGEALPARKVAPPQELYAIVVGVVLGALAGVLLMVKPAYRRRTVWTTLTVTVLLSTILSSGEWWLTLFLMSICMLLCAVIFAALSIVRAVLYSVLGVMVYLGSLAVIGSRGGAVVWGVGLSLLFLVGVSALLFWLMRKTWRAGRKGFYLRLAVVAAVGLLAALYGATSGSKAVWLLMIVLEFFAALLVFGFDKAGKGSRDSSRAESSGSGKRSGADSGFSGGGGSSGGGGASDRW